MFYVTYIYRDIFNCVACELPHRTCVSICSILYKFMCYCVSSKVEGHKYITPSVPIYASYFLFSPSQQILLHISNSILSNNLVNFTMSILS